MKRILFVCLGNICRSPLAEGIFRQKIENKGLLDRFETDSCGTANYHIGNQPDPRTVKNARRNGVQLDHCCRQFVVEDFDRFDVILAMDKSNLKNIQRMAGAQTHTAVKLMRSYDPLGRDEDVPDPYYGDENDFQNVFTILDRTIESFIQQQLATEKLN